MISPAHQVGADSMRAASALICQPECHCDCQCHGVLARFGYSQLAGGGQQLDATGTRWQAR
jgi:hypothetical protein